MSVPQIFTKTATAYVNKFKKDPEAMAVSYACLAAGYCIAYSGLILAIHELEKKENELNEMRFSIEKHNAYVDGYSDALKYCTKSNN